MKDDNGKRYAIQQDLRYTHPDMFPRAKGENCRFIVWALDPIIGIEDPAATAATNYWQLAFTASQKLIAPPIPPEQVGLVLQSAITRGQHQFHIHIGTITEPYRGAIRDLKRTPGVTQSVVVNGRVLKAQFVPDTAGSAPLSTLEPINVVRSMLSEGDRELPLQGILVGRTAEGDGTVIFTGKGLSREELNYKQPTACSFKLHERR